MSQQLLDSPAAPLSESSAPPTPDGHRIGLAYGRFIYRLRWAVIILWIVGLGVSIPFAGSLTSVLQGGGYTSQGSESERANALINDRLHQAPSAVLVVFQSAATAVSDPAYTRELEAFMARAQGLAHITSVTRGGVGQDGRTTYVAIAYDVPAQTAQSLIPVLRTQLPPTDGTQPAQTYITGGPAVNVAYSTITEHDVQRSEEYSLPLALIALIIVFGTLLAAALPLVLALVSVPVALAVLYIIASHTWTSIFVLNVATIIGLGIAIDYSLFLTRRFREELAAGRTPREAVAWTVATSGEAILFSGLTVMIGFAGLFLIGIPFMTSFAYGGMITVAAAVLAALTLLPALLSVLGSRINALSVRFFQRRKDANAEGVEGHGKGFSSPEKGFWHGLASLVMRRPVPILLGSAAVLVALGWPLFMINLASYGAATLPATSEVQQGLTIFSRQFPTQSQNPVLVVVQTPDGSNILAPSAIDRVATLSSWLAAQPHVTGVSGLTRLPLPPNAPAPSLGDLQALYASGAYQQNPLLARVVQQTTAGDTTVISVASDASIDSAAGKALIDRLRAGDQTAARGLRVQISGTQALSLDFTRHLYDRFPWAIGFVLVATFIVLLIMFRSLILPLKAVIVNTLSLGATYGALVFVFQQGHLHELLHFTSNGTIDSTIPILIFCILFGLSMDYEVFLLSRIREEWQATHDNQRAVAHGLERTGAVITNAALLFVLVAGSFMFTSLLTTQELGLGMTVAVLVDATIVRSLLVPATMRLLGKWNWWFPGQPMPVELMR